MDKYVVMKFWIDAAVLLVVAGNTAYTWWINRERVTNKRFEEQAKRIHEVETRIDGIPRGCSAHVQMTDRVDGHNDRLGQHRELLTKLETEFKHLPRHADLDKLSGKISQVHADLHEVTGAMPGLRRAVDLMNEFLINNGRK